MATAPAIEAPEANPIEEIVSIRIDQIDASDRLRPIDPQWAAALGAIMAREGQRTPIEVCQLPGRAGWKLVTGGHRVAGAALEGIEYLKAIIVGANLAERRMREVSENLWRRDLNPIDRAAFVAELVALHKEARGIDPAKDGRVASIMTRWQKAVKEEAADTTATIAGVYGWGQDVGAAIGLSERTIRNDLALYRRLMPSLVAALRDQRHPLATNGAQLQALAKLEHAEQARVVETLLASPAIKSVNDALAKVRGSNRAIDPEAKRLSTFIGTFQRMGLAEKKGALAQLEGLLPAGTTLSNVEGARGKSAPDERYRVELIDALDAAFKVLVQLCDGESVEDEDIQEACGKIQGSLMAANAGAIPAVEAATTPIAAPVSEPAPVPAVAIRASVKPDYLVCLECGEKHGQLKRHLSKHALDADSYIAKWRLPLDYPFTAPNVSEARRQAAQKLGLRSGAKPGDNA